MRMRTQERAGAHTMTDPQTESERAMSADTTDRHDEETSGTVALTGGALPCADCGQAVTDPDPALLVKAERVRRTVVTVVDLATCSPCAERDRAARDLAEEHLNRGVTVGDRRYGGKDASRLLVDAWTALDAAGVDGSPSSHGVGGPQPGAALAALVIHLSSQVGGLRWRDRLNAPASLVAEPVRLVEPDTANESPWGHLDEADRARLRAGMVQVLAERVARQAPPVALTPPQLQPGEVGAASGQGVHVTGGCLYCGLHSITMSALAVLRHGGHSQAVRKVWSLHRVTSSTVGGRGGSLLVGWLCPACTRAADDVGSASSPRSLEWALVDFLGLSRHPFGGDVGIVGLQAWGALVVEAQGRGRVGPTPNQTPWGHLPEEEQQRLAEDWRRG